VRVIDRKQPHTTTHMWSRLGFGFRHN